MLVNCELIDCANYKSGKCLLCEISIDIDGCKDYAGDDEDYFNSAEYQSVYWVRIKPREVNSIYRVTKKGKKIIVNGVDFYTESDTRNQESCIYLTDARTGYSVGDLKHLKESWDQYTSAIAKESDVMDLPVYKERERDG